MTLMLTIGMFETHGAKVEALDAVDDEVETEIEIETIVEADEEICELEVGGEVVTDLQNELKR